MDILPRILFVSLTVGALIGCAPPSYILLKPEASERIRSTHAHIVIPQEELNVVVEQSGTAAAAGGGLLFTMIDLSVEAKRANKANQIIEPVRKQLADFDFRSEFDKQVRTALADISWLKIVQVEVTGQPYSVEDRNRMRATIPQDSLLAMAVSYQLSSGLS